MGGGRPTARGDEADTFQVGCTWFVHMVVLWCFRTHVPWTVHAYRERVFRMLDCVHQLQPDTAGAVPRDQGLCRLGRDPWPHGQYSEDWQRWQPGVRRGEA